MNRSANALGSGLHPVPIRICSFPADRTLLLNLDLIDLPGASQLCDPHPKSLSLRERDFEIRLPFSLREKGLGDEGAKFAKVGCTLDLP
jgi:hypothetical protein